MASPKIEQLAINYTARNFSSIKDELISYTKRYYPNTFKDFSEASFGSLMIDMVSYVGDIMSFYLDYQANESFLQTAIEYNNIVNLARQLGYKFDASPTAHGVASFYILVPAATSGGGPDPAYFPVLKRGAIMNSESGNSYILAQDVNFGDTFNKITVGRVNNATGAPINYAVKAYGRIISGDFKTATFEIEDFKKFRKLEIPGGANISEVISVFDSSGNQYYEVDYLSQDVVYRSLTNLNPQTSDLAPNILKPVIVPRRFVIERNLNQVYMLFGHGSDDQITTDPIVEPNRAIINLHGRDFVTDQSFDPNNLISSDKLGVGPSNTMLNVVYRTNSGANVNAPVGTITKISNPDIVFQNEFSLSSTKMNNIISSIEVINEDPVIGDLVSSNTDEIKQKAYGVFQTQNRAVTLQDYKSMVYSMPPRFGSVARCTIIKDSDSFKRNLNLHILCKNSQGNFVRSNEIIKQNLKNWINNYRMINDSIDILDAHIINLGLNFEIISEDGFNKSSILNKCLDILASNYLSRTNDIGERLSITKIYKLLNSVRGVADTVSVDIYQKIGNAYHDTLYNIEAARTPDGRSMVLPKNAIYEFRYGTDFAGVVI